MRGRREVGQGCCGGASPGAFVTSIMRRAVGRRDRAGWWLVVSVLCVMALTLVSSLASLGNRIQTKRQFEDWSWRLQALREARQQLRDVLRALRSGTEVSRLPGSDAAGEVVVERREEAGDVGEAPGTWRVWIHRRSSRGHLILAGDVAAGTGMSGISHDLEVFVVAASESPQAARRRLGPRLEASRALRQERLAAWRDVPSWPEVDDQMVEELVQLLEKVIQPQARSASPASEGA